MSGEDAERLAWVALNRIVEPGRRTITAAAGGGAAALLTRALAGGGDPISQTLRERLDGVDPWARAEADLARAARGGVRAVTPVDAEWPTAALAGLAPLADAERIDIAPPVCLWLRGPVELTEAARAVAIVGARAATGYGVHVAGELGYGLAEQGWTVVSGGASGIDGAAHRGALAAGGVTVAVLAGGVDVPYPLAHAGLLDRIAEEGLLISEVPLGESPQRHRFLLRNRLVAALSTGLVVVEAGARSGTSVTADRAHQLGRPLMAVPGPVTSALSVGTHRLIRDFGATLVTSALDVAEEVGPIGAGLGWPPPHDGTRPEQADSAPPAHGGASDDQRLDRSALHREMLTVLEAVPAGQVVSVQDVALAARLAPTLVRRALPALAVRGFVRSVDGGYRLTRAGQAPPSHHTPDEPPDPLPARNSQIAPARNSPGQK